jgi:outer membrane cobalamin receptor
MRCSRVFCAVTFLLTFLIGAAFAADLKVKVVDARSAPVAGAQVELFAQGSSTASVVSTSAEGVAAMKNLKAPAYHLRVRAPGFATGEADISGGTGFLTITLQIAPAAETVTVTATRTPVPNQESGANVETLTAGKLETMAPVAANDALRFLPGAVVDTAGQRGGLGSLFVQGGNSNYNKVIVDGVTVNEPGGTFDFGTLPLTEADHFEFMRGAQSTLYGSDAMTSVVQVSSKTGSTPTPELRFGADGGNLGTANGYASLSGARGPFDYDLFADQFYTDGQGVNDGYSDSLAGGNVGVALGEKAALRLRVRHSNNYTGVQGEWNFNGTPLLAPDLYEYARLNDLLGSLELTVTGPSGWQHRFTGFDDHQDENNVNLQTTPGRISPVYGNVDFPFHDIALINRAGFEYEGDYSERSWAHTTIGYRFEDENGEVGSIGSQAHGVRLNDDVYGQQIVTFNRFSLIAGARFVHNGTFGNTGVPRVALTFLAARGGSTLSGTRFRFSYATGFKEPRLEETFAAPPYSIPNLNLLPERNRALEASVQQNFFSNKYALNATYFNNLFHDLIDYSTNPTTFVGQYVNVDKSFAQGAEIELHGQIVPGLSLSTSYTYTSTQILAAPLCTAANACDPLLAVGNSLLRRPRHSASSLLTYLGSKWGANLGGSFVGRRLDSDFYGFGIDHAAGYVRVDVGGWYSINSRVTGYVNIENALDKQYQEVVGYPALGINFRAGMRFRIGGE